MVGQFTFLLIISPFQGSFCNHWHDSAIIIPPFQGWMRRMSGEVPLFSLISPGSARENETPEGLDEEENETPEGVAIL